MKGARQRSAYEMDPPVESVVRANAVSKVRSAQHPRTRRRRTKRKQCITKDKRRREEKNIDETTKDEKSTHPDHGT
jgi:hypothetical protein